MSNTVPLRVAELVSSKICHDLVSPTGAVSNGIEILKEDEGLFSKDAFELIEKSARQALVRLSFYRILFDVGEERGMMDWTEVESVLINFAEDRKVELVWDRSNTDLGREAPRVEIKLLLNLFHLAVDCLYRGGVVRLENLGNGSLDNLKIWAEGPHCDISDEVEAGLRIDFPIEEVTVRNIVAYLAVSRLSALQKSLGVINQSPEGIGFSIL